MYAERTMYTIKQAASRSGVSVPLLRAWERRYGIVEPARTPSGYRLYDDDALDRIRTMRRLVDAGWTPSTAAGAILSGEPIVVPDAPRDEAASNRAADGLATDDGDLVERFVEAAIAFDADGLERVLDRMFAAGTFESVADHHLLPALVAIGDAWADGRLGVAGEHAASHAALRRLAAAFQAAGRATPPDGAILVGMPPTVRHELGALAFGTAARRAGLPVLYLGPDLPVDEWVATARRTDARAAVNGLPTGGDVRPAVEVATALRAAEPGLAILFGGRSATKAGAAFAARSAAAAEAGDAAADSGPLGDPPLVLPEPLVAAVRALEDAISDTASTPTA
jgi:methanogenic corrinoid protein MtbC1